MLVLVQVQVLVLGLSGPASLRFGLGTFTDVPELVRVHLWLDYNITNTCQTVS